MQTDSSFFPVPTSSLKWIHFIKIGSYLMIFFIFKKIFLYKSDFGHFLAKIGILDHFEAKKCANCLIFVPSPKFKS